MKKKDQLTPFLARELLLDYAKGKLSPERIEALEQVMKENPDLKLNFRNIEEKLKLLSSFDRLELTPDWIEKLSAPHPSLAQQIVSIEKKVAPRFWRALPLTVLVVSATFAIVLLKPWTLVNFEEVEVAEVQLSDDEVRMEAAVALSERDIEGAMKAQEEAPPKVEVTEAKVPEGKVASDSSARETTDKKPEVKAEKKAAKVGEIFRGFITVDALGMVSDGAAKKILALGGKKAGQVQLGWERDDDERYFHFSLPEKNKKALIDYLSTFGPVRLSSQEHPLVMPEGKIRIILVVKQNPQVSAPIEEAPIEENPSSEQEEPTP